MQNPDGTTMSDKEVLKCALDHMAEALCFLFQTDSREYQAIAFMLDSVIKLGTVIYHDGQILNASANWEEYESEIYSKHKRLKRIK